MSEPRTAKHYAEEAAECHEKNGLVAV